MVEVSLKDFPARVSEPLVEIVERPWIAGLPAGPATPEMVAKYEVYFSPGGKKWHRKKST